MKAVGRVMMARGSKSFSLMWYRLFLALRYSRTADLSGDDRSKALYLLQASRMVNMLRNKGWILQRHEFRITFPEDS